MSRPYKPSREEILASAGKTVPDVIGPGLKVLFCGINPGLYSGAVGHHFARPGNRFWAALFASGFTDQLLSPFADQDLTQYGLGVTNMVERATATADQLSTEELIEGGRRLSAKVLECGPKFLAPLGVSAYRIAFNRPKAGLGLQDEFIGESRIWLLPNPSGLNAHYQAGDLARLFRELRQAALELQ